VSARNQSRQSLQPVAGSELPADWQLRFKQQALIASGGMGEVYRGEDLETGQPVAIKRVKPNQLSDNSAAVQRLIHEGELLRQLNHPNIVKVLATIETGEEAVIVMEFVSGGSLRELLNEEPQLAVARAVNIGLELADALARAHHLNVIHRDIKPENVLLAEDGTPRLTDFGLACLIQPGAGLRQDGVTLGTTAYLSPEAWRGEELDARSDIWSFGVLLYEMLAGRPPFMGQHVVALLTAVLNEPQPDLSRLRPDAPPPLIDLLKQMLIKEREQRIDSMRQVAAGLELIRRRLSPFR
jgi:serine/threonine-protein kinase